MAGKVSGYLANSFPEACLWSQCRLKLGALGARLRPVAQPPAQRFYPRVEYGRGQRAYTMMRPHKNQMHADPDDQSKHVRRSKPHGFYIRSTAHPLGSSFVAYPLYPRACKPTTPSVVWTIYTNNGANPLPIEICITCYDPLYRHCR